MGVAKLGLDMDEVKARFEEQFKQLHLQVFNRPAKTMGEVTGVIGGVIAHFVAQVIEENNRRIAEQLTEMGVLPEGRGQRGAGMH
ncbi:MAG: hypothetical protein HY660_18820 [Armatimonadetes bacterium]|nr:hypothetical protein [Armatimonadota bacterium]